MKKYSFIRRIFFAFKQTEKPENWLLQKIKKNPFQFFLSLGLTLGGFFLFIFFLQIGFMPDMNFSEASSILIASALIGGYFTVLFAILPMAPIIFVLSIDNWGKEVKNSLKQNKGRNILFQVLSFFDILYLLLLNCIIDLLTNDAAKSLSRDITHAICYIIFLIAVTPFPKKDLIKFNSFLVVSLFLTSYFLTGKFNVPANEIINTLIIFFLIMILQRIIAYVIIDSDWLNNCFYIIVIAVSFIIILFLLTGAPLKISKVAVYQLGLGEMRNVSVLLKDEGCEIFNAIPMPAGQKPLCDEKTKIVRSVHLRSRIASPYVFEAEGNGDQVWRITIPKEQVISLIISGVYGSQPPNPGAPNNQTQDCPDRNQSPNPPQQGCASAAQNGAAAATK
jgi:membrane protein